MVEWHLGPKSLQNFNTFESLITRCLKKILRMIAYIQLKVPLPIKERNIVVTKLIFTRFGVHGVYTNK